MGCPVRKLNGAEAEWAKRALNSQGDAVLKVMRESGMAMLDKDDILKELGKAGHAFERWHVTAALKNLKERKLVIQSGPTFFGLAKKTNSTRWVK